MSYEPRLDADTTPDLHTDPCNVKECKDTAALTCSDCHGLTCEHHSKHYESHDLCWHCRRKEDAAKRVFAMSVQSLLARDTQVSAYDLAVRIRAFCDDLERYDSDPQRLS